MGENRGIGGVIGENQSLQELVEVCLGYMWDRRNTGEDEEWDYLQETIGVGDSELRDMFSQLGYEEDEDDEYECPDCGGNRRPVMTPSGACICPECGVVQED